jgi:hypothetical protein
LISPVRKIPKRAEFRSFQETCLSCSRHHRALTRRFPSKRPEATRQIGFYFDPLSAVGFKQTMTSDGRNREKKRGRASNLRVCVHLVPIVQKKTAMEKVRAVSGGERQKRDGRLHQAVKRTFTSKLSNMLGTQQKGPLSNQRPGGTHEICLSL